MQNLTKIQTITCLIAFISTIPHANVAGFAPPGHHRIPLKNRGNNQHRYFFNPPILKLNDNGNNEMEEKREKNFDGKGLVNYLGPYALAFLVSVAVTAGFVKFVLMDY